mmetsp:Transcript_35933/g.80870  ORF Transcript_35933/g.80870 Transcript_35933/m.80870 type:complete len:230 (-) Transcript_35933:2914-3603(-)
MTLNAAPAIVPTRSHPPNPHPHLNSNPMKQTSHLSYSKRQLSPSTPLCLQIPSPCFRLVSESPCKKFHAIAHPFTAPDSVISRPNSSKTPTMMLFGPVSSYTTLSFSPPHKTEKLLRAPSAAAFNPSYLEIWLTFSEKTPLFALSSPNPIHHHSTMTPPFSAHPTRNAPLIATTPLVPLPPPFGPLHPPRPRTPKPTPQLLKPSTHRPVPLHLMFPYMPPSLLQYPHLQ